LWPLELVIGQLWGVLVDQSDWSNEHMITKFPLYFLFFLSFLGLPPPAVSQV
jgi:hypothetical protein